MPRSGPLQQAFLGVAMILAAGPSWAQQPGSPGLSFEAALKKACPSRNLEFLPTETLARTTDAFVAGLSPDLRRKAGQLSEPGVKACSGNADDSCRTAALLGTLRYLDLSEPLAQRFCGLALTCTDWFQCTADGTPAAVAPDVTAEGPEAPAASPQAPDAGDEALQPTRPLPPMRQAQSAPAEPPSAAPPDEDPEDDRAATPEPLPTAPRRATAPAPARLAAPPAPPATPTQAVEGFYRSLGNRDGIAAASYLIPEKRGRGNYSAAAMQRFYGGLAKPLVLRSVGQIGPTTVVARYDFTTRAGAYCDGRSIVSLRPSPEGVLISSIRALSNC